MAVWLDVNPRSGVPIYLQLVQGVRHALELGALRPGDRLPTVRDLAVELTIAPNTIVRAYAELQRQGLVEARAGVGTVVRADSAPSVASGQREALFGRLKALARDAASLGVTREELDALWREQLRRAYDPQTEEA